MESKKEVLFPAFRFFPDKDERGAFIIDPRTQEFKSGILEVTIFKALKSGSSEFVSGYRESVGYHKYLAIKEDTERMNVEQLIEYFPELKYEEESTPESDESTGSSDASESGEKDTPKKTKATDKTKPKK